MGNAGFRQIDPEMWGDPYFLELNPNEKLLYIYMFTNERTSLCGLYEISKKQITFYSDLDNEFVSKTIKKFQESEKIIYENDIYFVINLFKRHFSKSPKVIARINNDIEHTHDCKPKTLCIQKYEELYGYPYPIRIVSGKVIYPIDTQTPKIREDKIRKDEIKENKKKEVEDEINTDTTAEDLIRAFVINFGAAGDKADETAAGMQKKGVTTADIIKAIEFMEQNPEKYTCVDFKSIRGPATIEMQKRIAKEKIPDKEDPERYIKGEYGNIGNH